MLRAARFIAGYGLAPDARAGARRSRRCATGSRSCRPSASATSSTSCIVRRRPGAGLWFLVDTGLADEFLPELPAMRLEQDPIHRHKDVLAHTIAVVENVQAPRPATCDFRSPARRAVPRRRQAQDPLDRRARACRSTTTRWSGARMTRERMQALRYSNDDIEAVTELVYLHLRFHTYSMGWTDTAVRRFVRDAGPLLDELNELTRCDCTTRNERKAAQLARRMDELEERIAELPRSEELASIRPDLDGDAGHGPPRHSARPRRRRGAGVPARAAPRRGPARRGRGRAASTTWWAAAQYLAEELADAGNDADADRRSTDDPDGLLPEALGDPSLEARQPAVHLAAQLRDDFGDLGTTNSFVTGSSRSRAGKCESKASASSSPMIGVRCV